MRKVGRLSHLSEISLEGEVAKIIEQQLNILDESYGIERNIDADLGGYVLILESKDDVIEVKENIVKDIIPEYVDNIECEGGKQYCLSLFLLSSDYAVFVVATKELMDKEIVAKLSIQVLRLKYSEQISREVNKLNYAAQNNFIENCTYRTNLLLKIVGTQSNTGLIFYKHIKFTLCKLPLQRNGPSLFRPLPGFGGRKSKNQTFYCFFL